MGASVLPAVVAAANATSSPVDGEEVTVDATRGVVTRGSRGLRLRSLRCALYELPRDLEANHRAAGTLSATEMSRRERSAGSGLQVLLEPPRSGFRWELEDHDG